MHYDTAYLPGLSPVEGKKVRVSFDGGRLSSDGGVLLLREIERRLGIGALLASCVTDERDPASTTHSYADMIRGAPPLPDRLPGQKLVTGAQGHGTV